MRHSVVAWAVIAAGPAHLRECRHESLNIIGVFPTRELDYTPIGPNPLLKKVTSPATPADASP
jgi:hypothetical protein